ncbi:T9SS type A sorting domain-containing protein [Mesonia sp. K7]|uniref:T9SS type A sorting domain-containing protein n=1 Tax=Mesonia sp. K7 TaxID=2218606 RepID=UPI000DA86A5D|nr:T9SS type A sorting domain-containing protein [Mesonia sp. K7]PZD79560.1 hypothetical protein DNG35_00710 [Mesonia sp. K7]
MKKITYLLLFLILISWQGIAQTTHTINWQTGISNANASLTIDVGDTVEWIFTDAVPHSVTSDAGSTETFDSTTLPAGSTWSYTFTVAGSNPYFCAVHPSMQGTITVNPVSGGSTVLDEDFEGAVGANGLPAGWTETGLSTDGIWSVGNAAAASSIYFTYPGHTNFAYSNDDSCDCDKSADRLITPALDLSSLTAVELSYAVLFSDIVVGETLTVEVSTDGGTTWTVEQSISVQAGWRDNQTLDLSAYAGQSNVMISFLFNDATNWAYGVGIDDVKVGPPPACITPANVQNTAVTATTADFSWDAEATATSGYNWVVMADGDDPLLDTPVASGSVATGITAQATGLTSATDYDFYVQSDCGTNGTSDWSLKLDFTTACTTFTAPFLETFSTGTLPNCWSQSQISGSGWDFNGISWNVLQCSTAPTDHTTGTGTTDFAAIDFSVPDTGVVLEMPIIDVSALTVPQLSFYMYFCTAGYTPPNELYIEAYDGTTWVQVGFINTGSGSAWEEHSFVLTPYKVGNNVQLRFRAEESTDPDRYYGDMAIDDVEIKEAPSCIKPINIQNTAVTPLTADFSWDAEATATSGYNWVVMADGDDPDVDTPVTSGSVATGTTAQATGLAAQTNYDFYVQSDCGTTNGISDWSTKVDFITDPSCIKPTNVLNTAFFDTTADFSWDAEPNATTGYNWVVMTDGDDPYVDTPLFSGSTPTGTTTVQVTGLTTDSIYDFYVQSDCGTTDGLSDWSDKVDFYTGYCPSQPSSNDGTGYGDIDVETTTFNDNADSTYENYTSSPVAIGLSEVIDIQIDLNTGFGYDYDYHIWVDYNNDLIFDNATEIVATGATAGAPDEVITASFTFSATMAGSYRMRIASADSGQGSPDPCYNGSYGNTADFVLELVIPCDAATGVMTTAVTDTTADFSWTGSADETGGYNWVVMADGDDPLADTPIASGSVATGVTIAQVTGLMANTAYDFYVQTNCVSGAISDWSTVLDFMTATCDEPTAVTLDNATGSTLDISWTASATETDGYNWILMNDGESPITDTPVDSGSVATGITMINITGLTNLTNYDFYVQTNCGNGNVSNWILLEVSTVRTDAETFRGFEYYPNPVNAELVLKAQNEMTQVTVYNLLGQKVMRLSPNNLETRLDFSAIQTGSYMVQVHINDAVKTIRIIKE